MTYANYYFVLIHVSVINFMVTPCISNIQHLNIQPMHTTLKNVKLLKHFYLF